MIVWSHTHPPGVTLHSPNSGDRRITATVTDPLHCLYAESTLSVTHASVHPVTARTARRHGVNATVLNREIQESAWRYPVGHSFPDLLTSHVLGPVHISGCWNCYYWLFSWHFWYGRKLAAGRRGSMLWLLKVNKTRFLIILSGRLSSVATQYTPGWNDRQGFMRNFPNATRIRIIIIN